jgi:hypothetical protein
MAANLRSIFVTAEERLRNELARARATFDHHGERGAAVERALRTFWHRSCRAALPSAPGKSSICRALGAPKQM